MSGDETTTEVTRALFSVFFATGSIEATVLMQMQMPTASTQPHVDADVREGLRDLSIAHVAAADALMKQLRLKDGTSVRLYPDSTRVVISELSVRSGRPRLALDLRRPRVRAVARSRSAEGLMAAQLFRGVVEGAFERGLLAYIVAMSRNEGPPPELGLSASGLFERAHAEQVPVIGLRKGSGTLPTGLSQDALSRLQRDVAAGYVAVAPRRAIAVNGVARFAWWRIDPTSGGTVGVTDEGLHGAVTEGQFEYTATVNHRPDGTIASVRIVATQDGVFHHAHTITRLPKGTWVSFLRDLQELLHATIRHRGLY